MTTSIHSSSVISTLDRLFVAADENDARVLPAVREELTRVGHFDSRVADKLAFAYIPVSRDVGTLLYSLARACNARRVVELGTSHGLSTIHLAAAVRDNGGGEVITTEIEAAKAARATENLRAAGLLDLVDLRRGDARETLRELSGPVDLLFLDGWKDLYLPIFELVAPRLRVGAMVVADDVDMLPDAMADYLRHVRTSPKLVSTHLVIGDGLELSVVVAA